MTLSIQSATNMLTLVNGQDVLVAMRMWVFWTGCLGVVAAMMLAYAMGSASVEPLPHALQANVLLQCQAQKLTTEQLDNIRYLAEQMRDEAEMDTLPGPFEDGIYTAQPRRH